MSEQMRRGSALNMDPEESARLLLMRRPSRFSQEDALRVLQQTMGANSGSGGSATGIERKISRVAFDERLNIPPNKYPSAANLIGSDTEEHHWNMWASAMLTVLAIVVAVLFFPFSLMFCMKVVQQYERAVIYRVGRLVTGGAKGPGLIFILPCIDNIQVIDLRVVSYEVPPQEILSKDSVTVSFDAVVYFRTSDAVAMVTNVEDANYSTKLLAQTTLRNVLGTKTLSEMLSDREGIAALTEIVLDECTEPWGIKVERVEVKDIRLPPSLTRAMAAEAEASREASARVIVAEGEERAAEALKNASDVLGASPAALQLRYLQTLNNIASEQNSTIVFPVPIQLFSSDILGRLLSAPSSNNGRPPCRSANAQSPNQQSLIDHDSITFE